MSDSDSDPLNLSARDLMQNWVNDLESPQNFIEKKYRDYDDRGGDQRGGGKGKGRGRGGFGGGGGGGRGGFDDRGKGHGGQGGRGRGAGAGQGGRGGPGGKGKGGKPWDNKRGGRDDRRSSGPPRDPAPQFSVAIEPSQETVEALAKHIRTTGRAYSMVDVARMVMASRDRYQVAFQSQVPAPPKKKKAPPAEAGSEAAAAEQAVEEKPKPKPKPEREQERPMLVRCKLDGSLWLTREEAIQHVLSGPLIEEFYQVEEVEVEAPKGNFSVIAVCGMSGTLLGPPNHHEYQTNLNKLYRERFSNMGFERFKSRIEMKRDEETIEAWKSSVSTAKHYRIKPPEVKKTDDKAAPAEAGAPPADAAAEPDTSAEAPATEAATESEDAATATGADTPTEAETGPAAEQEAAPLAESEAEAEPEAAAVEAETGEAATEGDSADSVEQDADDPSPAGEAEPAAEPEVVLSSEREVEQHFRENFARRVLREVGGGVVAGDVPGQNLSAPLFEKLKRESEFMRRGFPLPLIQTLCRRFEKVGLKFFKRDKKALYVSSARPRSISGESGMTDRVRQIVEHVRVYPNVKVPKLLESVIDGFIAPRNEEEMAGHKPTEEEISYLRDIRWLTKEGYLIEYSSGELVLGHSEPGREQRPAKKKSATPKADAGPKSTQVDASTEAAPKVEPTQAPAAGAETKSAPEEVPAEIPAAPEAKAPATEAEAAPSDDEAPAPSSSVEADADADAEKPTGN